MSELFNPSNVIVSSMPQYVFVELTRNCNMKCTMCRPNNIFKKENEMNDEILDKIEKQILPYAKVVDLRGWGESTLDNRLLPLIKKLTKQGKIVSLYTNFQARDKEYWKELLETNLFLAISLRSANKEHYEEMMINASYEKLIDHLSIIPKENNVYFTVVVGDENINDLCDIIKLAKKYNVKEIQLNPLSYFRKGMDYPINGITKEYQGKAKEVFKKASLLAKELNIKLLVCADLFSSSSQKCFGTCIHPWYYCYIRKDGGIGFCNHLLCTEETIMGNLSNSDFKDIWNNEKYQQIRKYHIDRNFNVLRSQTIDCDWCYENRYADMEHLVYDKHSITMEDFLKVI